MSKLEARHLFLKIFREGLSEFFSVIQVYLNVTYFLLEKSWDFTPEYVVCLWVYFSIFVLTLVNVCVHMCVPDCGYRREKRETRWFGDWIVEIRKVVYLMFPKINT